MSIDFDALPWHDATLLALSVDRSKPGARDEVRLRVAWPDGDENSLLFSDCYALVATMNFGIIADEAILKASSVSEDPLLDLVRAKWEPLGVPLHLLRCYSLETSSTASTIMICALRFELLPPGP